MWDSPAKVTTPLAGMIWLQAMQSSLVQREVTVQGSETEQTLSRWLKEILGMINASHDLASFTPLLRKYIVAETLHIESNRRHAILLELEARLQNLGDELTPEFGAELGQAVDAILTTFLGGVMLLLGTETRVLVGVYNGRPSWKKVSKIRSEEAVFALRDSILTTYGVLARVGPSEVWMVPEFREFDLAAKQRYEHEDGYLEMNRQLIEEAFYRQRYLIDPEGVFVKVTNSRDVTGVYLKVHPQVRYSQMLFGSLLRIVPR